MKIVAAARVASSLSLKRNNTPVLVLYFESATPEVEPAVQVLVHPRNRDSHKALPRSCRG